MNNKITPVTRLNIFQCIKNKRIKIEGILNEINFLSLLFDLDKIPSTDTRFKTAREDIVQHRSRNSDWKDYWIFDDERFNLMNCHDDVFLNFLCKMIDPLVRTDETEIQTLLDIFNENLKNDGYKIVEKKIISGKPIYKGIYENHSDDFTKKIVYKAEIMFNSEYISNTIQTMIQNVNDNPTVSIGLAKELIESCCKFILEELGEDYNKDEKLAGIFKKTLNKLKINPDNIPDTTKGADTVKKILNNMISIIQSIGELRNQYGTGHGKGKNFKGLKPRHARLCVNLASTLTIFLYETHREKNISSQNHN